MGMIRVRGVLDDGLYEVALTGDPANPVVGSRRVAALVDQWTGEQVITGPTGPVVTVDPGDARSLLALLSVETTVRGVDGDDRTPVRRLGQVA
jgi:hypothetical protein